MRRLATVAAFMAMASQGCLFSANFDGALVCDPDRGCPDDFICGPTDVCEPDDGMPQPFSWYKLNDDPSQGARDSGRGHDAGCTECPDPAQGLLSQAFSFDGTHYLQVPQHDDFHVTSGTITAWARPSVLAWMTVVSKPLGEDVDNSFLILVTPDGKLRFDSDNLESQGALVTAADAVTVNQWTHVAVTWSTSGDTTIWVDGELLAEGSQTPAFDSGDVYLGADIDNGVFDELFKGDLDDVRFYDVVLSADQIGRLATP